MADVERAVQALVDAPVFPPERISELERRVDRRRRRRTALGLGTLVATILVVAASVPALRDGGEHGTVLRTGPASDAPLPGPGGSPLVEVDLPSGWQTLHADGDRLVVGTRPLSERDLVLALLARDDAVFGGFPADGVVLVVGGDGMKAKYVVDPSRATWSTRADGAAGLSLDGVVGPGPPLALGPAKTLPGDVTVRLGDVPSSAVLIAAYAGPAASAAAVEEAEAVAATVRLRRPEPDARTPPPPGSRPGFDKGGVPVAADRMQPVASVTVPGATYTVRAADDCAVVVPPGAAEPLAGGCSELPGPGVPRMVAAVRTVAPPPPPPDQSDAPGAGRSPDGGMLVLFRVGPGVSRVTAELVDGRAIDAAIGDDGWGVVATDGRAFLLEALDRHGQLVGRAAVT